MCFTPTPIQASGRTADRAWQAGTRDQLINIHKVASEEASLEPTETLFHSEENQTKLDSFNLLIWPPTEAWAPASLLRFLCCWLYHTQLESVCRSPRFLSQTVTGNHPHSWLPLLSSHDPFSQQPACFRAGAPHCAQVTGGCFSLLALATVSPSIAHLHSSLPP